MKGHNIVANFVDKYSKKKTALDDHRDHSNKRWFTCSQCSETFSTKYALDFHFSLHEIPFPFQCPFCLETFKDAESCILHTDTHEGEIHECNQCSK